ncbi:MAG TPA: patatin-like phospholipase family protein [Streptosporangiaceae bacterium]|nr:patatin-like phospholipase family protein [Streptosporangiaceae bacterium]
METESEPPLAGATAAHEVLRALAARRRTDSQPGTREDGLRIALVIEGGAMRGVISAGMALALAELGLVPAFDAVYGASAGAITGAWLLSRPEGLRGWAEPAYAKTLIRRSALLRGRPVADIRALIEDLYQTTFPMDFAAVLASPIEFHPLATDAATGQSTDLRPFIGNPAELRLALRASAALPLLAGPPVEFAGRRFYDAGVSESVPYRTALAQGATHLLILRSRRAPQTTDGHPQTTDGHRLTSPSATDRHPPAAADRHPPAADRHPPADDRHPRADPAAVDGRVFRPSRSTRWLARTTLRRETPALREAFLARESRLAADDQLLATYEAASPIPTATDTPADTAAPAAPFALAAPFVPAAHPAVFSIRPAASSPAVSRLATNGALLQAALEAGRAAAHAALHACAPDPRTPTL